MEGEKRNNFSEGFFTLRRASVLLFLNCSTDLISARFWKLKCWQFEERKNRSEAYKAICAEDKIARRKRRLFPSQIISQFMENL
jgi:hypothetical protein